MATELTMPRLSDSMEEGTILKWLVAEGDEVHAGQPLVEVETDKATVTHEALESGVILALTVGEGASVPVGAPIAVIGAAGEEFPRAAAPEAQAAAEAFESEERAPVEPLTAAAGPAPPLAASPASPRAPDMPRTPGAPDPQPARTPPSRSRNGGRAKASPLARRIAAQAGLNLSGLPGSGPQGRVIRADVERALAQATTEPQGQAKGSISIEELSRIQQTVARRMSESRATVPDIELRVEVDMGEAVALRDGLRELADPLPSINDFVVKASALALRDFPRVNGAYRDGRFETFSRINVGIAVAAPDALLVPTIADADAASLTEIARRSRELAARVRDGAITPAELAGGTFTVSNLGMYGVDSFSAVINQPQAAILTVGALRRRPIVDGAGAIVARPTAVLTLACDHRILYGADGARFLARVRELLERPLALLV